MRDRRITVRLTDEQYEEIEKRRGNIPKSEYLYYLVADWLSDKNAVNRAISSCLQKCEHYQKLHAELGKIGGNINQISRALNKRKLSAKERKLLIDLVVEVIDLVQAVKIKLAEERLGNPEKD